jgi:hypothetical protein
MSIQFTEELLYPCLLEDNKTVMTTVTNYGYLMYTYNMLKSLKSYDLDKKVFIVCIDKKSASILNDMGYKVYCVENNELYKFCPWNSKGYDKICYLKLELLHQILSLQKNVLLIDGDIVFQKNPLEDLRIWWKDKIYDIWIQNDSLENRNTKNMCTGYLFIKSSNHLIQLYDCVSESGKQKYMSCAFDNNDQTFFNEYIKPYCKMYPLPLEFYPNGKMYYENTHLIESKCILIHFNWVHGHIKMAKMKEYKKWLLTSDEEETLI